jgi:drug/metabolite transporter (DMT)-like permease
VGLDSAGSIELLQKNGSASWPQFDSVASPQQNEQWPANQSNVLLGLFRRDGFLRRGGLLKSSAAITPSGGYVFRMMTILMLMLSCALTYRVISKKSSPIVFALISCMFFGIDNFFIAYAGKYLQVPNAHMALTFLFSCFLAVIAQVVLLAACASYRTQVQTMLGCSRMVLIGVPMTGILIVLAEVCSCIGYSFDLPESGPHQALAACNVLIVSPFFYFSHGERMNRLQLFGMVAMIAGAFSMADVTKWEAVQSNSLHGFLWLLLSMLLFAISDITLRFTSTVGVPWQPRVLFMVFAMGALGFPMADIDYNHGHAFEEFHRDPGLIAWPFLNALAGVLGLLSCTIAFEAPEAPCGVLTAIVNANSVILVVLNKAILGYDPSSSKLAGAGVIMVGVALFHASQN